MKWLAFIFAVDGDSRCFVANEYLTMQVPAFGGIIHACWYRLHNIIVRIYSSRWPTHAQCIYLLVAALLKCLLHTSSSQFQLDTVEKTMARVSSGIETKPRKIIIILYKFSEFSLIISIPIMQYYSALTYILFSVMIHMVWDFSSVSCSPLVPSFECDFVPISERD